MNQFSLDPPAALTGLPAPAHALSEYRGLGPATRNSVHGARLDGYLAANFPFHSRSEWKAVCQRGELLVDGRPMRASYRLKGGEVLAVYHPVSAEPAVDDGVELCAELGGVIAVYKPANLPMHESGEFRRHTFAALLASRFGPEWHPVHRLDRETSGILVCAATPSLRRSLSELFEQQQVEKQYLAICTGVTTWSETVIDAAIAPDPTASRPRYITAAHGLPARTDVTVEERAATATLLRVRPRTGRTNQIRVHLAAVGHPLIGDKIYHADPAVYAAYHRDGDCAKVQALAGFPRHALHAAFIRLIHPELDRELVASVPLPQDLTTLWASLAATGMDPDGTAAALAADFTSDL